ncbi:L-ribulose-5-phosphate 3-epimerase [Anoxybacterium hadale]|uniref:L-ribulose-5-phosphate 3-epimerase n=1 Tax=Anoxybacterium hadale TaxID=3408580 RepID=A0ACD1A8X5_9FIRM|nr:L-ribulose-5-phosphate 3-epimerase [Clostridiales bacterium]
MGYVSGGQPPLASRKERIDLSNLRELPLGLYEKAISSKLSWKEKLKLAKHSGFDFVEMNVDGTPERMKRLYSDETVLEVRRAVESTGIPIHTMALTANRIFPLGSEDAAIRSKGLELVERAICFASKTGIRLVHLAAYDEHGAHRNETTEAIFFDSMEKCIAFAARHGVILALETMDTYFMGCCENIMSLCEKIDSPFLQCYADVGNLSASKVDLDKDLRIANRHIVGVHLKDTRPGVYRDVLFGHGTVNFDTCLDILKKIDYQGFLIAEMWSYDEAQFHSYLKEANEFLRNKLANY